MAHIVFDAIIETNAVTLVALDDAPMSFLLRVNGNARPLSYLPRLMSMDAFRAARGPITA